MLQKLQMMYRNKRNIDEIMIKKMSWYKKRKNLMKKVDIFAALHKVHSIIKKRDILPESDSTAATRPYNNIIAHLQ